MVGAFKSGLERLNAFRALWECMGAFGWLDRQGKHNPTCMYGMYVWYVCMVSITI